MVRDVLPQYYVRQNLTQVLAFATSRSDDGLLLYSAYLMVQYTSKVTTIPDVCKS
jgi:hypothetical protein